MTRNTNLIAIWWWTNRFNNLVDVLSTRTGNGAQTPQVQNAATDTPSFPPGDSGTAFAEPHRTELAFAQAGFSDADHSTVLVTAIVITDEPQQLFNEILGWKDKLARDVLLPSVLREKLSERDLLSLVEEPLLRERLLGMMAVTSFSAYVYYARREELDKLASVDLNSALTIEPLVHRFSKKSETISAIHSAAFNFPSSVEIAVKEVQVRLGYELTIPITSKPSIRFSRGFVELAQFVAAAAVQKLNAPTNIAEGHLFENVRTRIRFAENVVTHERHTRDENPLPRRPRDQRRSFGRPAPRDSDGGRFERLSARGCRSRAGAPPRAPRSCRRSRPSRAGGQSRAWCGCASVPRVPPG